MELSAIELLSGGLADRPGEWIVACRAQGIPAAVERQLQAVADACGSNASPDEGEVGERSRVARPEGPPRRSAEPT